ncbi:MAG: hypothetical protein ACI87W_003652 [Halieaceae bacterium]|jgi:uncharacterized protein YciI
MPSYMAFCEDNPGSGPLREAHRVEHLAYIESILDSIQVAGPLWENEGENVDASTIIYRTDSLDDAKQLLEADPNHKAGIYASVRWFKIYPAAGEWVGGKNW